MANHVTSWVPAYAATSLNNYVMLCRLAADKERIAALEARKDRRQTGEQRKHSVCISAIQHAAPNCAINTFEREVWLAWLGLGR